METCLYPLWVAVCFPSPPLRALEADEGLCPGASVDIWGLWELVGGRHKGLVGVGETPASYRDCADQVRCYGEHYGPLACPEGFA